jgi:hypothetical protein
LSIEEATPVGSTSVATKVHMLCLCIIRDSSFYVRFYDSELYIILCALDIVASGIGDIIVQTTPEGRREMELREKVVDVRGLGKEDRESEERWAKI